MNTIDERAILIAGPTASGKSALALALAEQTGGVVINADSMQVYRELRILTARPSAEDEAHLPHALYGFVPASEAYSVGRFLVDAARSLAEARAARRRPIVVGGTGLYFKALLGGMSPIPAVPPEIRSRWRSEAQRLGAPVLHAILRERDPEMGDRLAPTDTQRLVRALEVLEATGRSLGDWQRIAGEPVVRAEDSIRLIVGVDRADLYRPCDARFDRMLRSGALEEAARLRELQLSPELPAMNALGVRPLLAHLTGKISLDAAAALAKTETRQYVKRQFTWARRNMIAWRPIDTQQ